MAESSSENTNITELMTAYNYFVENFDQNANLEKLARMDVSIDASGEFIDNRSLNSSKQTMKTIALITIISVVAFIIGYTIYSKIKYGGMK